MQSYRKTTDRQTQRNRYENHLREESDGSVLNAVITSTAEGTTTGRLTTSVETTMEPTTTESTTTVEATTTSTTTTPST